MSDQTNPFLELSSYAIVGALAGLYIAALFDASGMELQFWSESIVRLIAGAGDSIGEVLFVSFLFLRKGKVHATLPYVLGKLVGMAVAPLLHFLTFAWAPDPHGMASVLYIAAYSNFDNLFGGIIYLITRIRMQGSIAAGWRQFISEPYQVGNLLAVGSLISMVTLTKFAGLVPLTHSFSALESGLLDTDSILASVYARIIAKNKKEQS